MPIRGPLESSLGEGLGNLETIATETVSDEDLEAELDGLEFTADDSDEDTGDLDLGGDLVDDLGAGLEIVDDPEADDLETSSTDSSGIDLPPMPEF